MLCENLMWGIGEVNGNWTFTIRRLDQSCRNRARGEWIAVDGNVLAYSILFQILSQIGISLSSFFSLSLSLSHFSRERVMIIRQKITLFPIPTFIFAH
ncbi:unnamed protein product [Citrullus colocynthis]|uniref:Uncharacterized protein n=1 Tax=Citrullus colocynthis TaxID=252529 RepID=A0ABP0YWJ5_9ROSI